MQLIWILVAILPSFSSGEIRIKLDSPSSVWKVRNDSRDVSLTAFVPGGIYSDLNLAHDLFNVRKAEYRDNYRWVGYENWTYETTFELSREILDKKVVNLVFHGIDTIGNVYLNGKLMRSVDNMFVRYVIPIKNVAKEGPNTLQIRFKSPVLAAQQLAEAYGYEIPPNCSSTIKNGECHINFLRKMQASFSSELNPAVPSVGIWKPVEIEAFNTAIVRDVAATIQKSQNTFLVNIVCHFEGAMEHHPYLFGIRLNYSDYSFYSKYNSNATSSEIDAANGSNHFILNRTLRVQEDPKYIWWPNGYGNQPLWDVSCEVIPPLSESSNESSILQVKTGLRTVEIVQDKSPEGFPVVFKINGASIFARGATWIPSHILPELASEEKTIRNLLQSVKDANMNMLRVWGGGMYESDLFYQIADELGILIWQDMMFASGLYPANEKFLQTVAVEINQQMKRLVAHPSIVIWAGNNDVDEILATNTLHIKKNTQYLQDYIALFENTIRPIIQKHDISRWYATPNLSDRIKAAAQNSNFLAQQADHFFHPDSNPWAMSTYKHANLVSRYNIQSLPSYRTMYDISNPPADLKVTSEFSTFRQHNPSGYEEMIKLINYNLVLPPDDKSQEFYQTFIYYSQITQAMAKKTEIEKYRISRSRMPSTTYNEGSTLSALLWHLNDIWQAPTCSSIEFGGRWKMLHYYSKKFFAPVIIVPELQSNGDLIIYGISDLLNNINGRFFVYLFSWDSMDPITRREIRVSLQNSTSTILTTISLPEQWKVWKEINDTDAESSFLYFRLEGDNKVLAENFYYPSSFSEVTNFKPARLTVTIIENSFKTNDVLEKNSTNNEVSIYLDTTQIALFVWLETDAEGLFSDNGFTMIDGTKFLRFSNGNEKVDITKLKETIKVRSPYIGNWAGDWVVLNRSSARLTNSFILILLLFPILKALI